MIPTGVMQAVLPIVTGVLRDRGLAPRYLVGLASWQIAGAAVRVIAIYARLH